jgi:hypothetical protein
MSDSYLREWATQLALRFPELGVLNDIPTLRTPELAGLIAFFEGYRARMEAMSA